jgi:hypothetical protein
MEKLSIVICKWVVTCRVVVRSLLEFIEPMVENAIKDHKRAQ